MGNELDLYGRGSTPRTHLGWQPLVAAGVVTTLLLGFAGYRWMTSSTPVSQARALDIYRAGAGDDDGSDTAAAADTVASTSKDTERKKQRMSARPAAAAAPRTTPQTSAAGAARSDRARTTEDKVVEVERRPPEEGVYSWDTRGYEEAGGARRSLPEESQRIITHHPRGWKQHHYFSEQREIWTTFQLTDRGAAISYQRNKVVFGPITNDSHIDFDPAMLVGPRVLEVGQTWSGSWEGKTYGTYEGKTFERVVLDIGGEEVETFGIEVNIRLEGEQEGNVIAKVWIAPEYSMTVKEHFIQNVSTGVGSYHAEWTITLKSLEPRR